MTLIWACASLMPSCTPLDHLLVLLGGRKSVVDVVWREFWNFS